MITRRFALGLALALGLAGMKGVASPSVDEEFARLQSEQKAALDAVVRQVPIRGSKEEQAIQWEQRKQRLAVINAPFAARAIALVRTQPASSNAVEICLWLLREARATSSAVEAAEVLARHHVEDPRTLATARGFTGSPEAWTDGLLRQLVAAKLPFDAQGRARWALADCLNSMAGQASESDPARAEKLRRESVAWYEQIVRVYGSQPHGDTTLGEYAQRALRRHRDLVPGRTAPATVGADTDDLKFSLNDYRGRVVLLVFCGHWCGPCREMYPHEREIHARFKDRPFAVIGVNSDTDLATFRQVRQREHLDWRWFWDGGTAGPIDQLWGIEMWPTTVVIDHRGVIQGRYLYGAALDRRLEELVAKAEGQASQPSP